jgi:hypothetical protein
VQAEVQHPQWPVTGLAGAALVSGRIGDDYRVEEPGQFCPDWLAEQRTRAGPSSSHLYAIQTPNRARTS